jgi:hypothetical protein
MKTKKLYLRNGDIIASRDWLSDASVRSINLTKKSKKDFTCVFGCSVLTGSSYLRVDLLAGGGCGTSNVELAFCDEHKKLFHTHPKYKSEFDDLDGEDITNLVFQNAG